VGAEKFIEFRYEIISQENQLQSNTLRGSVVKAIPCQTYHESNLGNLGGNFDMENLEKWKV
jgi:hypothetical protein